LRHAATTQKLIVKEPGICSLGVRSVGDMGGARNLKLGGIGGNVGRKDN